MQNNSLFLGPLRQYLKVIEQEDRRLTKVEEDKASKLCLSKEPVAVMNIWQTLIEAQNNLEFSKFMLTMGIAEEQFEGKITGWQIYKHKNPLLIKKQLKLDGTEEIIEVNERLVYIPETKTVNEFGRPEETLGPLNPYRSFKTSHATIARTLRNIESLDLEFVYSIVFTLPAEVSNYYLETSRPVDIDIRINRCTKKLAAYLNHVLGGKIALAVNKHVWSSQRPLEPHAHLHVLLLDRLIKEGQEEQIKPFWFLNYNSRTKRFEEGFLTKTLKKNWASIVNEEFGTDYYGKKIIKDFYQALDVNIEFVELKRKDGSENVAGHRKLIHKMKYNRRRPVADLALFYLFNEFDVKELDVEFAEHLINYENRTQVYGYWTRMSKYAKKPKEELKENEARCPVCNETLVYVSFYEGKELPKDVRKVFIDRKGSFWSFKGVG